MLVQNQGITFHDPARSTPGLTLFARNYDNMVRLIDMEGREVHSWNVTGRSTNCCMLLPNGNLWMNEKSPEPGAIRVGASGYLREYDWDGNIVWEYRDDFHHHDRRRLPNGGAVYIAWKLFTKDEASRVKGGLPGTDRPKGIYGEILREVDAKGNVTWEWSSAALLDKYPLHPNAERKSYGHANAVDILPDGNYLVSLKALNLLIIIDRRTGEVIWEFQNDELGGQHDAQMTPQGTVLVFGNGLYAPDLSHSAVWEIDPKTNEVVWQYKAKQNVMSFFSPHISGCQRLPSGNTLIAEGAKGCIFETTPDCEVVWEYVNPYWGEHPIFGPMNWMFRARRYASDSPEIQNRV